MKKFSVLFSAFLLVFGLSGVAGATSITYDKTILGDGQFTSSQLGVIVETFDASPSGGLTQPWTWTPSPPALGPGLPTLSASPAIVQGTLVNNYAQPFGTKPDPSNYLAVAFGSNGSVKVTPGGTYNYLGIWWGSIDPFNTLTFSNGQSFTGSGLPPPATADGDQTSTTSNLYVNFFLDTPYTFFTLSYDGLSFEVDNIAVADIAAVPEPATLLLLGAGLVGIGVYARRKFKK